jgi:hypothetical protein
MKVTLRQPVEAQGALIKLLTNELPIKASFVLKSLVKQTASEYATYELERVTLIKKHGTPNPDKPDVFDFEPAKLEAFKTDMDTLLDIEIDMKYEPISVELLGDDVKMTAVEMAALDAFLTA